jgi:hypothetical protein
MGLVCFIAARMDHHYPSGVGFIIGGMVFSSFMKVKKTEDRREERKHGKDRRQMTQDKGRIGFSIDTS